MCNRVHSLNRSYLIGEGRAMDMQKRYVSMTMTELVTLKQKKVKAIHKLLQSGLSKDKKQAALFEDHIRQINAEIACRVEQLPLWK